MASSGYNFLIPQGLIEPETGEVMDGVATEYQNAFNDTSLITTPNTPQGVLIAAETIARQSVLDNNAALANQINPNYAGGIFLDAILALLGSQRTPASPSTVFCTITGVAGTSIPAGAQISDSSGATVFALVSTTVIPTGGTALNVEFQSVATGPVAAPAGFLTVIVSNVLGWETVTNPTAATLGTATQSDTAARQQRLNTLAAQGSGLAEAITSALFLTTGVTSLTFQENISSSPQTINDILMVPHSLYTCVAGTATNLAIAETLTNTKSGGCAYNNGLGIPISQPVINQYSGQTIDVLFDRPSMVTISIIATVHQYTSVQDPISAVQNAILLYIGGGIPNIPGWNVGIPVSPFQLAGAINIEVPGLFVENIQVGIQIFTT